MNEMKIGDIVVVLSAGINEGHHRGTIGTIIKEGGPCNYLVRGQNGTLEGLGLWHREEELAKVVDVVTISNNEKVAVLKLD